VGEAKSVSEYPFTAGDEIREQAVFEEHWYTCGCLTFGGRSTFIDMTVVAGPGLCTTTCIEAVPCVAESVAVPATSLMATTVIRYDGVELTATRELDVAVWERLSCEDDARLVEL
jgi:hypothetical protein